MSHDVKKQFGIGILVLSLGAAVPRAVGAQEAEENRKVTRKVAAVYPPIALQARLTGTVKLMALVTPEGAVKSVRTIGGNPLFVTAAENAVKQWRYEASKKESTESVAVKFVGPQ